MDETSNANQRFEAELEELILSSFGSGEEIEGVWDLEFGPDEIPDWTVTIDRKDGL